MFCKPENNCGVCLLILRAIVLYLVQLQEKRRRYGQTGQEISGDKPVILFFASAKVFVLKIIMQNRFPTMTVGMYNKHLCYLNSIQ